MNAIARHLILSVAIAAVALAAGCDNNRSNQRSSLNGSQTTIETLDFGQDWDQPQQRSRGGASSGRGATRDGAAGQRTGGWAVVLGTFSGEHHAETANAALRQITAQLPELATARVHSTERGSMLLYGSYSSADDSRATGDLNRIKEKTLNGHHVFARAFLSPIPGARQATRTTRYELLSVRERHPNLDPLYTLQIAAWSDFDSGRMSWDEVRRRADAHVQQLRSEGHEAYVHHDERQRMSVVTVGLFDHTAIDTVTGEMSVELRELRRRFPAHLYNGEELHEPVNRRQPGRGTRVQEPQLVRVPMR